MIALFYIIVLTIFIEALIEAKYGDRRHWLSLVMSLVVVAVANWILKGDWIVAGLLYVSVRAWFDLLYNTLRGKKWSYLGSGAFTDRILKKINPLMLLFGGRFVGSSLCLIVAIGRMHEAGTSQLTLTIIALSWMGYLGTLLYNLKHEQHN